MDNQHRLVKGYRDLNQSEIDGMNSIKLAEQDIGQLFQQIKAMPGVDQRCLALAKTGLQEAFHWFVRAVAQPIDVYELKLPESEPETFITRLRTERDDLVLRLNKLNDFITGDKADTVPAEVLEDLKLQARAMTDYALIVSKRYDELTE